MSDWFRARRLRTVVATAVLAGFLPLTTAGCFGQFQVTRKIYAFNKEVSPDKWVRWLTFVVLNFIPVYGFGVLVDAVIANSIEFWTGKNPVVADAGTEKIVLGPSGEVAHVSFVAPGRADLELIDSVGRVTALELVAEGDTVAAYDRDGRLLMRVGDRRGQPAVLARGE
jgi:hypothetical protein